MFGLPFQVLVSVPCVLITPKRKLAGRLAVLKSALHFFGEFLVEGTGGSSIFKKLNASGSFDAAKLDQLGGSYKHKSDLDTEKGSNIDNVDIVHDNVLQKQPKNIKRHRRWNVCKVQT